MSPVQQKRQNPLFTFTFPLLAAFMVFTFTGLPEMIGALRMARPVMVVGGLGLIAVFVTGRFMQVLFSPIGKLLSIFTIWFILCIPMSMWRGGSFEVFTDDWSKAFLAYFLTAGLIATASQAKKAFHVIAYSIAFLALLTLALHTPTNDGRLALVGTRYGNANELAWTLLVGLAFLGFMFQRGNPRQKALAAVLAVPELLALLKTGSRAGIIGAVMLFLFAFFQASKATRAKLAMIVPIVFVAGLFVLPTQVADRYTTFFSRGDGSSLMGTNGPLTEAQASAIGSTEARIEVFKDAVYLSIIHPFAGVGPGNFPVAQNGLAQERGKLKGQWHVTHDTYLQLSSEMGIPGLVIYLIFLFECWRQTSIILRSKRGTISKDVYAMGQTLRAIMIILMTVAIFDSYAYNTNIPIVAGLITALSFIAKNERAAAKARATVEQEAEALPAPELQPEPAWSTALY